MEFVTVSISKKETGKIAGGSLTNSLGVFDINSISPGNYTLKVSFVGFKPINRDITVAEQKLHLGEINIEEDSKMLKEVEIVGQGSQMKFDIDKKIFSVDQNIAASGGSATEVLQNIPSVNVDNEGNVSLRNNENVEIWINGRPSGLTADNRAQVLQQLPAENLESIEIMTNPSAKFSPEGTAGIINLVMKKDRKAGYYGSASLGGMMTNGNKVGGLANISLNYSHKKVESYMNLGVRKMGMEGESLTKRTNYSNGDTTHLYQDEVSDRNFGGLFFRAGVDYHLNDKNTLGISGFGMSGKFDSNSDVSYLLKDKNRSDTLQHYLRNTSEEGTREGFNINGYHKIDFDTKGSNLTTNLGYSGFNMGRDNSYEENIKIPTAQYNNISQQSDNLNKEIELKSDFTKKITENERMEAGWNSSYEQRKSLADGFNKVTKVAIDEYFNDFTNDEWIHAAYFTYGKKINKLSLQAGLRGEYQIRHIKTVSKTDTIETNPSDDFQLFPSVYLGYSLPSNNEIQLNYTRRVNRPRGRQINSFRDYSNPAAVSYGNPLLTPEYASAFELNYLKNWDNHSISTSAYHRFTTDVIQQVNFYQEGLMHSTYMNLTKQKNTGLEFVAKNRLFSILNLTTSLNMYYNKIDASKYTSMSGQTINIEGKENFTWDSKLIANILFGKTFSGQVTAQYQAPQVIGQGTRYEMYSVDFGLRKTFFDRNLSLALTGRDIFNSRKVRTSTSGSGFTQTYESLKGGRMGGGRVIGLTATYSFGNMKPKQQDRAKQQSQNGDAGMEMEE